MKGVTMGKQLVSITWMGIDVQITYQPNYLAPKKSVERPFLSHIQIQAQCPLPITSTGYRSRFLHLERVLEEDELICLVTSMLDEEAKSSLWKAYWSQRNQLSLF